MKIGYSAWGFVGDGVIDSPDGGRLTRALMFEYLIKKGYNIVWLQENRDIDENYMPLFCNTFKHKYIGQKRTLCNLTYNDKGFPYIDVLFLEWRWRLPGRNCDVSKNSNKYTSDLDRQEELLNHYILQGKKIFIWDKDETMTPSDERDIKAKAKMNNSIITIFSPALFPIKQIFKRTTLHFPCDISKIRGTKVNKNYEYDIGYVGSQYDRDYQVYKYINPVSVNHNVLFVGNWIKYHEKLKRNKVNFPCIKFKDRVLPKDMSNIYNKCLATVLLCKENYAEHGHITQRIHECLSNGVIAIGLKEQKGIEKFIPKKLIVEDAYDLNNCIKYLKKLTIKERQEILDEEIDNLKPFDVNNVIETIEQNL